MQTRADPASVVVRMRPLTERGAQTRLRLLEAATLCLSTRGYGATTTQAVTELAAVSRGSMLHQFQTRLDMMEATAGYAMEQMVEAGRRRFDALETPAHGLMLLPDVLWELQREPPALALTEILLAARWEPGLAERLGPVAVRIEDVIDADLTRMATAAGIRDHRRLLVHARLMIAAVRGLAIELMFNRGRRMILKAADALREDHVRFIEALLPTDRGAAAAPRTGRPRRR
ncbi:TetR/AcrR family transcriptional regulator [Chelatococcus reniformis]|uniref:TetR family transcriptional regulator n=1 Tax=Chelatococcus reniformis TaxID=1494448 RepID=A0A916XP57_9HYPH|nr:TetR/AcrR family transcriptional regulator [Chelatococcus reniformis]GGC87592.1 TetR family transcriptional regulator [Chelatococcus reniformis]